MTCKTARTSFLRQQGSGEFGINHRRFRRSRPLKGAPSLAHRVPAFINPASILCTTALATLPSPTARDSREPIPPS